MAAFATSINRPLMGVLLCVSRAPKHSLRRRLSVEADLAIDNAWMVLARSVFPLRAGLVGLTSTVKVPSIADSVRLVATAKSNALRELLASRKLALTREEP